MSTEPFGVLIEFIGIMKHYTILLEAEYIPFLTEIWKFCKVLQTENTRKTKGDIGYSAGKIFIYFRNYQMFYL